VAATALRAGDRLPLTCTRSGTCCHGKQVWLNPWELACLAAAKGVDARAFRDRHTDFGGIRLRFDGGPGWRQLPTCSQYDPASGCTVHGGRPLACRLYPLGREREGEAVRYLHEGKRFPCLDGCPDVIKLPHLTVGAYLAGQDVAAGEAAQDAYLEVVRELADGAFVLLLESGLAASGDRRTLRRWRELGRMAPAQRAAAVPGEWLDQMLLPSVAAPLDQPHAFAREHAGLMQVRAQAGFASLADADALHAASSLMMALALHLAQGLGCIPAQLATRWVATAKEHGAHE